MAMNATQIRDVAAQAGFRGNDLKIAVAVALCESSGNPKAIGDGGHSIGLWQIHRPSHPWAGSVVLLQQPLNNAKAAFRIANTGRGWANWTMYRNGCYRKHLNNPGITAPGTPGNLGGTNFTDPTAGLQDMGIANLASTVRRLVSGLTSGQIWIRIALVVFGIVLFVTGLMVVLTDIGLSSKTFNKVAKVIPG